MLYSVQLKHEKGNNDIKTVHYDNGIHNNWYLCNLDDNVTRHKTDTIEKSNPGYI